MIKALFTLDYEIHGNGEGSPYSLMVEPTGRMLDQFDSCGAKLTLLADVAEIRKFGEYKKDHGKDAFHYDSITHQLRDAIRRGHDVQLHLHTSYLNSRHENGRWEQDWNEYNLAGLPHERLTQVIRDGKEFLESLLRPVNPDYRCNVFRAANWSVSPSTNVARALLDNDFQIDTSIFKFGKREGLVNFDYNDAWSHFLPWPASESDFCKVAPASKLVEFPIYSEKRWIGAFLTPNRIYRSLLGRIHKPKTASRSASGTKKWQKLLRSHAWKADFNQCSAGQLIRALKRVPNGPENIPFVLIGHSKLFTRFNQWDLWRFLSFVMGNPDEYAFGVFADFDLKQIQSQHASRTTTPAHSLQLST